MKSKPLLEAHIELSEILRDTHYGHSVVEYSSPPSAGQFAKAVGQSIPFVVRGVARSWPAIDTNNKHSWTNEYLSEKLGDNPVTVSLTGNGFADAVTWLEDDKAKRRPMIGVPQNGSGYATPGQFVFASPYETQLPFTAVLSHLLDPRSPTVAHLQLQNDCLRSSEYSILLADVPSAIPSWATPILGAEPEALNFWMGHHRSISSMHSDPYENIYTVIRGVKIFTLYPPCDAYFMHKQEFRMATWRPVAQDEKPERIIPNVELVLLEGEDRLPWIPITYPALPAPLYPRFAHAPKPFVVRVNAGDSLYLPKGWLHHVEQEEDEEGLCIAVNAWYDGWEGMGLSWGWGHYAQKMETMFSDDEP